MTKQPTIHREAPSWKGQRTAAIGTGTFSDLAAGVAFLEKVCSDLEDEGFGAVVGPMDGNTWGKYRLPIWSDGSAGFAMEPVAGSEDYGAYVAAGFLIAEEHVSATAATGSRGWGDLVKDVVIESWDGEDAPALLMAAHQLVMNGFAKAPFFTPIPPERFVAGYLPLLSLADKRFILRATDSQGRIVGLTLAFPDPMRRGAIVLKTYVASVAGVGRAMADRVHELAGRHGYLEVVHALMREGIVSAAQSRKFGGRIFRRYARMGRLL